MTTTMRLLPVRVSATLRAVIDQAGPVNPATRALIILGAAATGAELRGLEREIAALLAADLHDDVHTALRQVFTHLTAESGASSPLKPLAPPTGQPAPPTKAHPPNGQAADPFASENAILPDGQADDPFATIGIDV